MLSTHARMTRTYQHLEPDRVPITDGPWESTIARWQREGMPAGVDWRDHLGVDRIVTLGPGVIDTSPRFEPYTIEETDTYRIERDSWGITKKNFKPISSTPLNIDHAIKDRHTWQEAKRRMTPSPERIHWEGIEHLVTRAREEQAWLVAGPWFGYDIVNARMVGSETLLMAMADDPAWCVDMFDHLTDLALALLDTVWERGYRFDAISWPDDMGYKNGLLFSKQMWREMARPYQKRAIDWAHAHGVVAEIHSCGNISALVPDLVELGLDALNPLEVKAGMDPVALKREFGRQLVLRGGFDALHWDHWPTVEEEIRQKLPVLMEGGGYVFSSDHSIPDNTSLDTYTRIVALVKDLGTY